MQTTSAATPVRSLGTVSETGPLARPREGFARFELRGRRSTFARSSIDFVGAALSQGAASTLCELGDSKMQKTLALCLNWASGLCANHLGCDACTESRNGLGDGPIGTAARRFRKV